MKGKFPSPVPGRFQPLPEMCPLFTRGSEKKAASTMTHQREIKIVSRLERIHLKVTHLPPEYIYQVLFFFSFEVWQSLLTHTASQHDRHQLLKFLAFIPAAVLSEAKTRKIHTVGCGQPPSPRPSPPPACPGRATSQQDSKRMP